MDTQSQNIPFGVDLMVKIPKDEVVKADFSRMATSSTTGAPPNPTVEGDD